MRLLVRYVTKRDVTKCLRFKWTKTAVDATKFPLFAEERIYGTTYGYCTYTHIHSHGSRTFRLCGARSGSPQPLKPHDVRLVPQQGF